MMQYVSTVEPPAATSSRKRSPLLSDQFSKLQFPIHNNKNKDVFQFNYCLLCFLEARNRPVGITGEYYALQFSDN